MNAHAALPPRRLRSVCVFGSTETGHDPNTVAAARRLGQEIALGAVRLVYGGGSRGLVGAVAKGAAACNGNIVAIPHRSQLKDMRDSFGAEHVVAVADIHIRKRLMFDYADAFVALPGGVDTVDAMTELLTRQQLEQHHKPLVIANFTGLWTPWLKLLDHLEDAGFSSGGGEDGLLVAEDVSEILPLLRQAVEQPGPTGWIPFEEAIEDAGGFYSPPNP